MSEATCAMCGDPDDWHDHVPIQRDSGREDER